MLNHEIIERAKNTQRRLAQIDAERDAIKQEAEKAQQDLMERTEAEIKSCKETLTQTQTSIEQKKTDIQAIKAKITIIQNKRSTAKTEQTTLRQQFKVQEEQHTKALTKQRELKNQNEDAQNTITAQANPALANQESLLSSLISISSSLLFSSPLQQAQHDIVSTRITMGSIQAQLDILYKTEQTLETEHHRLTVSLHTTERTLRALQQQETKLKTGIAALNRGDYIAYLPSQNPVFPREYPDELSLHLQELPVPPTLSNS